VEGARSTQALIVCGIAGFTHTDRNPRPDRIWKITRALAHRGPDRQDVWEGPFVSLGAVRLKIIDFEHGAQPMLSDDGDTVLVFNGEIYNHAQLRDELAALGRPFHSRSDTEVLLQAFLEWDTDAFAKLRGMFAAAFWSRSRRRLVLVRDRMGIKPLYYMRRGTHLYFGSEMKAILLHPEVDRHLNIAALEEYLARNYVAGTHTLVGGIEKLAPGHWMEWRDGEIRIQPYWRLRFDPDPRISLDSAKEELDALLRSAVREHLISDAPLGVWSSGGLDSSTILHYAAEQSPAPLKTFSVSFHGRSFDESEYFRTVARHYGTDHHEFDLNPDSGLQSAIEEFAYYSDEPCADAGALPVWFLSKMCVEQVTVALSGDGADELFGGYKTYLADRYAQSLRKLPRGLLSLAAGAAGRLPVSDEKIGWDYMIKRMLAGALLDPIDAHFYWNGTFSAAERRALLNEHAGQPALWAAADAVPAASGLNRFLLLDQLNYLPGDILVKCDRMSMAHSLEVRPPFLDHRIVEFAGRLPESLKIRGNTLKFVLRQLMRDKLPHAVLKRGKEGFDIPAHHWLRTVLRPLLTDTLSERNVRETGIFSWNFIQGTLRAHLERRANLGYHLWGLLILFLWMNHWEIQAPSRLPEKTTIPATADAIR
jgi:asparagine synthase (glutamine-hydrolysing)